MHTPHPVCTREQWNEARKELLTQEKHFTRLREQLSERRRALPWVRVAQDYTFHNLTGARSLAQLFEDKAQLVIYHLMFAPEWEAACKSCSFWADSFDHMLVHLAHRDVGLAAVSRAPAQKLAAYQERMGWTFPWLSSAGSTFNYDFAVSFTEQERTSRVRAYNYGTQAVQSSDLPGISIFCRDGDGGIFHTYSCYSRGIDMMNATYQYLDLVPKGRDEGESPMGWLRRHDEYAR